MSTDVDICTFLCSRAVIYMYRLHTNEYIMFSSFISFRFVFDDLRRKRREKITFCCQSHSVVF